MAAIEPTGVRAQQPMHPFAQIGVGRFDDQMKMVAQQAIRMHLPISLLTRLSQRFEEVLPIHVVEVNVIPAVSPAHDMVDGARILDSQLAWHASNSTVLLFRRLTKNALFCGLTRTTKRSLRRDEPTD